MATVELRKPGGKGGGNVDLDPSVFEAEVRSDLLHAEVRRQLASRRAGTHATRNRAAVSGGGSKPYRQKGTGRARQGTIRAPQFAGGGTVFGPVPRGHGHRLNKRVRRAALRGALSLRQQEEAVSVVEALSLDEPRTQVLLSALADVGVEDTSLLIVVHEADRNLELAARNLPRVDVIRAEGVNVYDVLRHKRLLLTRPALDALHTRLAATGESA